MNDVNSLSHTSWNCKYHIVFAPKYRRKVFYGQKRKEIGEILRKLCEWKKVKIIEAEVYPDHIHMLVEIPPKYSVYSIVKSYNFNTKSLFSYCTANSTHCGSYPSAVTVTRTLPGSVPARTTANARPSHVV